MKHYGINQLGRVEDYKKREEKIDHDNYTAYLLDS
jgi:hypothetical protein